MNLEGLLQPKDEGSPSGENLEYDPVFMELELAAQPKEGTEMGSAVTEAEPPDYREMSKKAQEVLERSHDLRAAVYLADAALNMEGMAGFAEVTSYIRGCLEQYWDGCHPELDEDDDDDPTMRINTIQGLCGQPDGLGGPSPVFRSLRRAALTNSRGLGIFSMRDIDLASGQIQVPEGADAPDMTTITGAFRDTDGDWLAETLAAARQANEDVRAISAVFDEQTPGQGPELDPLIKLLYRINQTLGEYAGGAEPVADGEAAPDAAVSAPATADAAAPAGGRGGAVGAINSPADVSNALDKIVDYYRRAEPSSPVPVLLERAKRLVNADFLTIVKDMAPEGLENVNLIGGIVEEEEY